MKISTLIAISYKKIGEIENANNWKEITVDTFNEVSNIRISKESIREPSYGIPIEDEGHFIQYLHDKAVEKYGRLKDELVKTI